MEIEEIKIKMKEHKDFFGGNLLEVDKIDSCTTKEELKEIIKSHYNYIEDMCNDAQCSLDKFERTLELHIL